MYEFIQLGKNTYVLQAPANIGFYCFDNREVCVIDSGINAHMGERILRIIEEQGWSLKMILTTHHHADHVGGNAFLQEKTGCKIYSSEVNAVIMQHPLINTALVYGGDPYLELHNKLMMSQPCECEVLTQDCLPAGFEMRKVGGHSYEMMIYKTPDDVWFLGDSVLGEEVLQASKVSYVFQVGEYLKSLAIIETLNASRYVPSHGSMTSEIGRLVHRNQEAIAVLHKDICKLCVKPISFEKLAQCLFQEYHMELDMNQYSLYTAALRSHLTYLESEEKVIPRMKKNVLLWEVKSVESSESEDDRGEHETGSTTR